MNEVNSGGARSHMVAVVGIDLTDVSEHLLARACDLVRRIDDAELHVVHVVQPEPLRRLIVEPVPPIGFGTRADTDNAREQLERVYDSVAKGTRARVVMHTPVGRPADEIARIARETAADIIVVEVHDHPRRVFHHSVVARLARIGPCSLLAIRDPGRVARKPAPAPKVNATATGSATAR